MASWLCEGGWQNGRQTMTIKSYLPLNTPTTEYEEVNERVTRRTIEQNFQDVASDLHNVKTQNDKDGSLAMRKYQFVFLGASNG